MKRFFLYILLVLLYAKAGAQQMHFVFLQSDNHRPFYALLNNKNYSSSSIGYVILPKLQNGDYAIKVGFPKSEEGEQEFLLQVKDNDQGFLIKDFGDKGWGLFNLQSMVIQYAGEGKKIIQQQAAEALKLQEADAQRKRDSVQTAMAAQQRKDSLDAVAATQLQQQQYNDSVKSAAATVTTTSTTVENPPATTTISTAITNNTGIIEQPLNKPTKTNAAAQEKENERLEKLADSIARVQAAAMESKKPKTQIQTTTDTSSSTLPVDSVTPQIADADVLANNPTLLQKTFTDSGWRYTYAVGNSPEKEKIDVFIPVRKAKKEKKPAEKKDTVVKETPVIAVVADTTRSMMTEEPVQQTTTTTPQKTDTQFLDFTLENNTGKNVTIATDTANPGVKVLHNSNCRAMADEKDFMNARKKIVAADGTEKMVAAARKIMKEKCFTTEQIKNLSFLFLTDADRYQFLDAAYPFALDAYRFGSLKEVLKEDYYIQRFKAMLR